MKPRSTPACHDLDDHLGRSRAQVRRHHYRVIVRGLNMSFLGWVVPVLLPIQAAGAQTLSGCTSRQAAGGSLVVRCRRVTIEVERGADFRLIDRDRAGEPEAAMLGFGAVYVDDTSKAGRSRFQIQTPDAIASVRGTNWAVDVTSRQSSVFVVRGIVGVRRRLDSRQVTLSDGEGVDVAPEMAPLVVKRWGAERVRALLARFGR